jgi:hypothetical protein
MGSCRLCHIVNKRRIDTAGGRACGGGSAGWDGGSLAHREGACMTADLFSDTGRRRWRARAARPGRPGPGRASSYRADVEAMYGLSSRRTATEAKTGVPAETMSSKQGHPPRWYGFKRSVLSTLATAIWNIGALQGGILGEVQSLPTTFRPLASLPAQSFPYQTGGTGVQTSM